MAKSIKVKGDSLDKKISTLGYLFFGGLSINEINVLAELVKRSNGVKLNVSAETSSAMKKRLGLNDNSYNVSMHRLVKKGVIKKTGGVVTLHPVLNGIFEENEFVIRFVPLDLKEG